MLLWCLRNMNVSGKATSAVWGSAKTAGRSRTKQVSTNSKRLKGYFLFFHAFCRLVYAT